MKCLVLRYHTNLGTVLVVVLGYIHDYSPECLRLQDCPQLGHGRDGSECMRRGSE